MKGLFLNGFYSAVGNIKLFLLIVAAISVALMVTGSPTAQELFVYITITALSVNAVVSSRKEAASRWSKYEITMPVRRKDIVQCKYLTYIFWVAAGTIIALVVTIITMIIHGSSNLLYGMSTLYSMFVLGIGISLLTGAFFYPISYVVGMEKSETVLIISILIAVGLSIAVLIVLNQFSLVFAIRMVLFIGFYSIAFAVSYGLTLGVYLKKEIA